MISQYIDAKITSIIHDISTSSYEISEVKYQELNIRSWISEDQKISIRNYISEIKYQKLNIVK